MDFRTMIQPSHEQGQPPGASGLLGDLRTMAEDVPPLVENVPPQAEDVPPQAEDVPPLAEDVPPHEAMPGPQMRQWMDDYLSDAGSKS